jgi:hypothetical protein
MNALQWLQDHQTLLLYAVVVLLGLVILQRAVGYLRRRFRRRGPAEINPRLAKYAGTSEAELQAQRAAAARIVATSSTGSIAGYELVRQIEAVFVEGLRSPEEAMAALKSAAGKLGANAVINLTHVRTTVGRYGAQGDAVIVRERENESSGPTRPTAPPTT